MPTLIDTSYFQGKLLIGQIEKPAKVAAVNAFISEYEPNYLQKLMGYSLYKAFSADILLTDIPQRTQDLLYGKEFTDIRTDSLALYPGLTPVVDPAADPPVYKLISPIANYVYYQYQIAQATMSAGTGEVAVDNQNAQSASPVFKAVDAWNTLVKFSFTFREFMRANKTVYPEYKAPLIYETGCMYGNYYGNYEEIGVIDDDNRIELFKYKNTLGI